MLSVAKETNSPEWFLNAQVFILSFLRWHASSSSILTALQWHFNHAVFICFEEGYWWKSEQTDISSFLSVLLHCSTITSQTLSKLLHSFNPVVWVFFVHDVMVLSLRSPKLKLNVSVKTYWVLIQWALQESWLTSRCVWQVQIWKMHNGNLATSSLSASPRCCRSCHALEPHTHSIKGFLSHSTKCPDK